MQDLVTLESDFFPQAPLLDDKNISIDNGDCGTSNGIDGVYRTNPPIKSKRTTKRSKNLTFVIRNESDLIKAIELGLSIEVPKPRAKQKPTLNPNDLIRRNTTMKYKPKISPPRARGSEHHVVNRSLTSIHSNTFIPRPSNILASGITECKLFHYNLDLILNINTIYAAPLSTPTNNLSVSPSSTRSITPPPKINHDLRILTDDEDEACDFISLNREPSQSNPKLLSAPPSPSLSNRSITPPPKINPHLLILSDDEGEFHSDDNHEDADNQDSNFLSPNNAYQTPARLKTRLKKGSTLYFDSEEASEIQESSRMKISRSKVILLSFLSLILISLQKVAHPTSTDSCNSSLRRPGF
jgi:hypothetical protein